MVFFLIIITKIAKFIGIANATMFPNNDPPEIESPTIKIIPLMARRIDIKPIKETFSFIKEKVSLIGLISILLAMSGIILMVGDSISGGSLFGNIVALAIPINFAILVMIIRKNTKVDMVPAIFYSGIFSLIYGFFLAESFEFTKHDLWMGFLLGVPQLAVSFICITIGSRTVESATVGILMLMETLCAPLWVWLFLNEIPPISVFIGGAVIISAIILKSFDKKHSKT